MSPRRLARTLVLTLLTALVAACGESPCPEGSPGCACTEEGSCDPSFGPRVQCVAGTCERLACTPGERGCACPSTGACAAGTQCFDGTCDLPQGHLGQACLANRTCKPGGRCDDGTCVPCALGTEGCACADDACAAGGQCIAGLCTGPAGFVQPIPEDPKCYTPCRADYVAGDGTVRRCAQDGLFEGCVDGNACRRGTCLPEAMANGAGLEAGESCTVDDDCGTNAAGDSLICVNGRCAVLEGVSSGACTGDAECPDFQVCIAGQCFANCASDDECPSPARCHLRACRLPCLTGGGAACPAGSACQSPDGQGGFCMPTVNPASVIPPAVTSGSFELLAAFDDIQVGTLDFTNVKTTARFRIRNRTAARQTFKLRRLEHTEPVRTGGAPRVVREQALSWLRIAVDGAMPSAAGTIEVLIDAGADATVDLTQAGNPTLLTWSGVLGVEHGALGTQTINLGYRSSPEGRWSGTMYFFSNFSTVGLDAWKALPRDQRLTQANATQVKNAFMQQWIGFLRGDNYPYDRLDAMLLSTQVESYEWPLMRQNCPEPNRRCYPFDNTQGFFEYTSNIAEFPIPRGMTELPLALELRGMNDNLQTMSGRVVTDQSLQYAGDPAVQLQFAGDPLQCGRNASGSVICPLDRLQVELAVGGRFTPAAADTPCTTGGRTNFEKVSYPWLVPGFLSGTEVAADGSVQRAECRDATLPFGLTRKDENLRLVLSNPIPDGRTRRRNLQLVDGALIDGQTMVVLFREAIPSFLGTNDSDFSGLGFMVLRRAPGDLAAAIQPGNPQTDNRTVTTDVLAAQCSPVLLGRAINRGRPRPTLPSGRAEFEQALRFMMGQIPQTNPPAVLPADGEFVHYLCVDTGQFDGGGGGGREAVPCPASSRVRYFTTRGAPTNLGADGCNAAYTELAESVVLGDGRVQTARRVITRGTCESTLEQWLAGGRFAVRADPIFRCEDDPQVGERERCDDDPFDLRLGKLFYALPTDPAGDQLLPLETAVDLAFRYKTRFVSRSGRTVGFAPSICGPGVEYCYDPEAIEELRERVDCLTALYTAGYATLAASGPSGLTLIDEVGDALRLAFSYRTSSNPATGEVRTQEGFERLNAELLVMLGDEAYTKAFASRFDLAGQNLRSFQGRALEGNEGIDLSGGAGFEMFTLYQALQYYELALERFYRNAPRFWASIGLPSGGGYVTNETVSAYFSRVIRASTQKAKTQAEIARRYQSFNRTELAKRVALRAYTAAYLEAMVASNVLSKLRDAAAVQDVPEIERNLRDASLRYRAVLLDMRDLYTEILESSGAAVFGYRPDEVPFPALDPNDINAFERVIATAKEKLAVAAEKEDTAISGQREFDTDEAAFQSELTQIQLSYDAQIADACGTFVGEDGRSYPATTRFAYLSERTRTLGDPCGLVGNGGIHEALVGVSIASLELKQATQQQDAILARINVEETRIAELCDAIEFTATVVEDDQREVLALDNGIRSAETIKEAAYGVLEVAGTLADLTKCSATTGECATAAISSSAYVGVAVGVGITTALATIAIQVLEDQKAQLEIATAKWVTNRECTYATIESNAVIKNLWIDLLSASIGVAQATENVRLAASQVVRARNAAQRLIQEQQENEQLAINVQAARNDPNARIYKNDAILTADRTFKDALREAWRATRIYEYYTSQSYARKDTLFLVRLASRGDISLEEYLSRLEQDYASFEETFGNPDTRVLVISLRDDVLKIPRVNARTGAALREADRVALFRRALLDPNRLDGRGYISLDFPIELGILSPLTNNHKVFFTEAEWVGSDLGDAVGRIYLTSKGTGTVRDVNGRKQFFALPPRTAVINTFFNGYRDFFDNTRVSDVYANFRMRDLPVANNRWQVVINTKDEVVNQDVNLASLSDVRIHVYYRDFTEL